MKLKGLFLLLFCGTSLWCLAFQVLLLRNVEDIFEYFRSFDASADVKNFLSRAPILQERLFLIDKKLLILHNLVSLSNRTKGEKCIFCSIKKYQPITFALLCPSNSSLEEQVILPILKAWDIGFWVENIISSKQKKFSLHHANLPLGFLLQKGGGTLLIEIVLLHEREGDFWWHGSFHEDLDYESKLQNLRISSGKNHLVLKQEGALDKFSVKMVNIDDVKIYIPSNIDLFVRESTQFIECNYEQADRYYRNFGKDTTTDALKFVHRARKVLGMAKYVLDELQIPFWICSGTLLGYFRQCDMIPYSGDIDIGIFINNYRPDLIEKFESVQFKLKYKFGRPEEAFELSFQMHGIKLDIFFFYDDGKNYWNGAHEIKSNKNNYITGEKFKYTFPKFTLCWTEFLEMKLRIPCDTETFIRANYGPHWFTPVVSWHYVKNAYNVEKIGDWSADELKTFIELYEKRQFKKLTLQSVGEVNLLGQTTSEADVKNKEIN